MPSVISAVTGLMALSSIAAAFPQTGVFSNGTAPSNTTSGAGSAKPSGSPTGTNTTSPVTESLFCPQLSGSVILSSTGAEFLLACSTNHFGIVIDVEFNSTLFSKRQAITAPSNIQDCLLACDSVSACVGTAFNVNERTCTLFSEVGAAFAADGIDFATRVSSEPPTTEPAGATLTSTLYSTTVYTIASCAPTVTDCPLNAGAVVTEVIPVTSTEYVCPSATVIPAGPVACTCAFSASTATVYSTTNVGGSVTVVPVGSSVIAVPSPSGTTYSTTTVQGTAAITTAPVTAGAVATAKASSSGKASPSAYTGAASQVKAAGGLGAFVAAAALLL